MVDIKPLRIKPRELVRAEALSAAMRRHPVEDFLLRQSPRKLFAVILAASLILSLSFGILLRDTRAGVTVFHATSCGGGWDYSENAAGAPDLAPDAPRGAFTSANSAVLADRHARLSCGGASPRWPRMESSVLASRAIRGAWKPCPIRLSRRLLCGEPR